MFFEVFLGQNRLAKQPQNNSIVLRGLSNASKPNFEQFFYIYAKARLFDVKCLRASSRMRKIFKFCRNVEEGFKIFFKVPQEFPEVKKKTKVI